MIEESPSREAWRFPLWAEFKNWVIGFSGALLVVVALVLSVAWYLYKHQPAQVDATKPAIADMGIPISQPANKLSVKTATKKKATPAINTPAVVVISPEVTPSAAPPELAPKPAQQPAMRGPERPLPPSPPFPPLPPN